MIVLLQNTAAISPNNSTPFEGSGGVPPYVYSVLPGGAGGTINPSTGLYTAPVVTGVDTISVVDSLAATAQAQISIQSPLQLICDIIKTEMDLDDDQVYLWDQKINKLKDNRMYVVIGVVSTKPFGNTREFDDAGNTVQYLNMQALLDINIISRGPEARDRKEEILLALKSQYAETQQEANSFFVAPLSTTFVNLSEEDGAAIPYRFVISVQIQYTVTKSKAVAYYDTIQDVDVLTDP